MGRNHTGPLCNVGRPTAHAASPAAADRPPAALQMTTTTGTNNRY